MKKIVAVLVASGTALLASCGGGAGDAGSSSTLLAGGASEQPAYLGTWQAACDGHERQVLVVALKGDGSGALELTPTTETYFEAGCGGALLATESMSATISAAPDGIADILLKLPHNAGLSDVRIDKRTLSIPAFSFTVTGAGVEYLLKDGLQQWCISHDGGASCVLDEGARPAQSIAGGLFLRDNQLYTVVKVGDSYVHDTLYRKK